MRQTYSFLDVNAAIVGPGGAFSLGQGAGPSEEGIDIEPTEDINTMQIGADGYGQHSLSANKSGKIIVRILKQSPVNNLLQLMYNFQTAAGANHGQNTITLVNTTSGDVITCQMSAFKKAPKLTYAKVAGYNEWEFESLTINRTLGNS